LGLEDALASRRGAGGILAVVDHIVAYSGRDPGLMACGLFQARQSLIWQGQDVAGWGTGSVQGSEVLLTKQPRWSSSIDVDLYDVARSAHADAWIGAVRLDQASPSGAADMDPFRFRSWLFALAGGIDGFPALRSRLTASLPEFLRRNMQGHSAGEHLFHLFLAFLHDGGLLDARVPDDALVRRALHQSLAFAHRLSKTSGFAGLKGAALVTNGRLVLAESHGVPVHYWAFSGLSSCTCPACPVRRAGEIEKDRRIDHAGLGGLVVEARPDVSARSGWIRVSEGATLVSNSGRPPVVARNGG